MPMHTSFPCVFLPACPNPKPQPLSFAQDEAYPGWTPNPSSQVVQLAKKAIGEVIGKRWLRWGSGQDGDGAGEAGCDSTLHLCALRLCICLETCTWRGPWPGCCPILVAPTVCACRPPPGPDRQPRRPDATPVQLGSPPGHSTAGREPHVTAIHAGLECGIIGEKVRVGGRMGRCWKAHRVR